MTRRGRRRLSVCVAALALALTVPAAARASVGDVYLTDNAGPTSSGAVFKLAPTGGAPQVLAAPSDTHDPNGLVLDRSGVLLLTDFRETIRSIDRASGAVGVFTSLPGGSQLANIAIGPDQNLYVTDEQGQGALLRIDHVTKAVTNVASNFTPNGGTPAGIVVERDGTSFVSDFEHTIYRVSSTGAVTTLASSPILSGADGLAITPDERTLYVAAFGSPDGMCCNPPNTLAKVDLATGAVSIVASFPDAVAVTLRPDRSFLVSDTETDVVDSVGASGAPISAFSTAGPPLSYPHDMVVEPETCAGKFPNVVGTTGDDHLRGSAFADVISTLGGNDVVKALGGNDIVCGGPGKDKLFGQGGNDKLFGQSGKDELVGGKGKDRLLGGKGADVLKCTPIDPRCK